MRALIAVIAVHIVASLASTASAFTCAGDGGRLGERLALKRLSSTAVSPPESVSGTHEALVVFARFSDDSPQAVPSWGNSLFRPEAPGSVAHYYEEQSFGRLHLSGTVLPQVYAAPDARSAYLASDATGWGGVGRFVREVLERADRDVDFGRFDANGDGMVDLVVVLVVGEGIPNFIKGKATGVMGLGGSPSWQTADGVGISPVGGVVAVVRSFPHAVGSVAHELGHWLGLPDLYDLSATGVDAGGDSTGQSSTGSAEDSAGIGMWGLMGWGALGWDETGTQGPTPFGAWEREQLGWVGPPGGEGVRRVVQPQQGVRLAPAAAGGGLVKVWLSPEEYFLIELRDPLAGWYERGCPGRGLLIWHVDGGGNQGDERHKLVDVECADGRYRDQGYPAGRESDPVGGGDNLDFWSHDESYRGAHSGNRGDATDLLDGMRFAAFTPPSNPGTQQNGGAPSGLTIANVHMDAAGASFDVEWGGKRTSVVGIERVRMTDPTGGEFLEPGSEGRVAVSLMNRGSTVVGRVEVRLEYDHPGVMPRDTMAASVLGWPGDTTTVVLPLRVAAPLVAGTGVGVTLKVTVMPEDGAMQTRLVSVPLPELDILGVIVRDGGRTGGGWGNGDGIPNPGEIMVLDLRVRSMVGWGGFPPWSLGPAPRVRFPDLLGESVERPLEWPGRGWADSTATIRMWNEMLLPAGLAGHDSLRGIFEFPNRAGKVGWVGTLALAIQGQDATPPRVRGVEVTVDGRQLRFAVPDTLIDEGGKVAGMRARLVQIPSLTDVETVPLEREGARFAGVWEVPSELAETTLGVAIAATDDAGNAGMTDLLQRVALVERAPVASSAISRLGKGAPRLVAYSPDGALLAVAATVGIWLYDAATLQEVGLLEGPASGISALTFGPDGALLASGDYMDHAVHLWDVASRRESGVLSGHTGSVTSVAFSPDGTLVASASGDSTVRLWDVARQQGVAVLAGHTSRVERVTFCSNGKLLASVGGTGDNTVRLWNVTSFEEVAAFRIQKGSAYSAAFTPDGALLATIEPALGMGTVHLWDVVQGTELGRLKNYSLGTLALSPDGRTLAVGQSDISLLDVAQWKEVGRLKGHKNSVRTMAFSPDGATLVSRGGDDTVRLWDVVQQKETGNLEGYASYILMIAFSPDGTTLTVGTGGYSGTIHLWDMASLREFTAWRPQVTLARGMALSPDGTRLAVSISGSSQSSVYLWDVTRQQAAGVLAIPPRAGYVQASALAFSPDGNTLAAGYSSPDRTVRLWDVQQQKETAALLGHTGDVQALAFSPGGQILASGSADSTVRLWDMAQQQELAVLRHAGPVWRVAFNPDGRLLVSGGGNGAVYLWDMASYREITVLRGYPASAGVVSFTGSFAFHPTGTILALGSDDGTVYLWDVVHRQEVGIIGESTDRGSSPVVFSPDGKILALSSGDGTVLLWSIMPTAVEPSSSDEPPSVLPRQTALLPAYPNPGNPGVWLPYDLAKDGDVTIRIYNVAGQQVRTLAIGRKTAGRYLNRGSAAFWDGRTTGGREVASGVYYCALHANAAVVTRKAVVLR